MKIYKIHGDSTLLGIFSVVILFTSYAAMIISLPLKMPVRVRSPFASSSCLCKKEKSPSLLPKSIVNFNGLDLVEGV